MPPTPATVPVPLPHQYDKEAFDWLHAHGMESVSPPIRSSDLYTARQCEFQYYLRNRLGIVPAFQTAGALQEGTMFHAAMEKILQGSTSPHFDIRDQEREIRERADHFNVPADPLIEGLNKSYDLAVIWAQAAINACPWPERLKVLGTEVLVADRRCPWTTRPIVARFDAIVYDPVDGTVWVVDFKTTSDTPRVRLSTAPFEFQSMLYSYLGHNLLHAICEKYDLPKATKFSGIIHYVIQKPGIRIRKTDVDKEGPDEARRIYLDRVTDWYNGAGEFLHLSGSRTIEPAIDISFVPFEQQQFDWDFRNKIEYLNSLATRQPYPGKFMRSDSYIRDPMTTPKNMDGLSIYSRFYVSPVAHWPTIFEEDGFVREFRDSDNKPEIEC